jgi:hypothetical protein
LCAEPDKVSHFFDTAGSRRNLIAILNKTTSNGFPMPDDAPVTSAVFFFE